MVDPHGNFVWKALPPSPQWFLQKFELSRPLDFQPVCIYGLLIQLRFINLEYRTQNSEFGLASLYYWFKFNFSRSNLFEMFNPYSER
jgi:hypothetical protein